MEYGAGVFGGGSVSWTRIGRSALERQPCLLCCLPSSHGGLLLYSRQDAARRIVKPGTTKRHRTLLLEAFCRTGFSSKRHCKKMLGERLRIRPTRLSVNCGLSRGSMKLMRNKLSSLSAAQPLIAKCCCEFVFSNSHNSEDYSTMSFRVRLRFMSNKDYGSAYPATENHQEVYDCKLHIQAEKLGFERYSADERCRPAEMKSSYLLHPGIPAWG